MQVAQGPAATPCCGLTPAWPVCAGANALAHLTQRVSSAQQQLAGTPAPGPIRAQPRQPSGKDTERRLPAWHATCPIMQAPSEQHLLWWLRLQFHMQLAWMLVPKATNLSKPRAAALDKQIVEAAWRAQCCMKRHKQQLLAQAALTWSQRRPRLVGQGENALQHTAGVCHCPRVQTGLSAGPFVVLQMQARSSCLPGWVPAHC